VIDTEYLRVKQTDTGHELTVSRTVYEATKSAYDVLKDEEATDAGNNPLPPKYAAPKKTAASAASPKENS
jgi:hypothetical protein